MKNLNCTKMALNLSLDFHGIVRCLLQKNELFKKELIVSLFCVSVSIAF